MASKEKLDTRVVPTDAEITTLVEMLRGLYGGVAFEDFLRRAMVHFGDEIGVNLREVPPVLINEFALRFHRLAVEGRIMAGGTTAEWLESDASDEVMDTAARQTIREMFGGPATMN